MGLPLALQAQNQTQDTTLVRTVVVEQEYNPDIMDASKINVLPQVEVPVVSKKAVEYNETLKPATEIPATTMQSYTGIESLDKAKGGYARLGYGNYNNLDLLANYLFTFKGKDWLNLNFGMDGMNGKLDMGEGLEKWKSRYYRTHAGVDYQHRFRLVDLNLGGHFGLSNFNFMPEWADGKQKFTSGDVHIGLENRNKDLALDYALETNLLLYQRQYDPAATDAGESLVRTKAEVSGDISDEQLIRIGFYMDNAFYQKANFDNSTSIGLNPSYQFHNDDWNLRLGAHVDMAFGFGKQFRAAPDVQVQFNFSDSYLLYAQATGGKLQNDFRRMESLNPYGQLYEQLDATYEQLNAAIGFKASPTDGLWFNLYGGYQNLKNDVFGFTDPVIGGDMLARLLLLQEDTWNMYAGAEISYSYKDMFGFRAAGVYRNWDTDESADAPYSKQTVLGFKPAFEGDLRIDASPMEALRLSVGYNYTSRTKVEGEQADPVSNLYVHGSYELFKGITVYARLNNLLNKEDICTGGYEQGRSDLDYPDRFGGKYYYMQGINCFLNLSYRF